MEPQLSIPEQMYDLDQWKLQLPIKTEKSILEIKKDLSNYQSKYFSLTKDKALAFYVESDGDTTPNSKNPRTELREMTGKSNEDGPSSFSNLPLRGQGDWPLTGSHTLTVECAIMKLPPTEKGIIIGQIHGNNNDLNPQLCKLYFDTKNKLTARIKNDLDPSSKKDVNIPLGNYDLGQKFTYTISMVDHIITITVTSKINKVKLTVTRSYTFKNKYWDGQKYYFKVGNYYQINHKTPRTSSLVHCYLIKTDHQ